MDFKPKMSQYSIAETALFKQNIIDKWTPVSDVWALRFGDEILGTLSTFGSLYITHFFRRELKIRPFATLTCYIPVVGVSAITIAIFQASYISKNILNRNTCPSCVSAKASIGQVLSLGYTLIAAPTVCFYVADRLLTYPVPPLARAPKEVFLLYQKIVKKYTKPISIMAAVYMVAAYFITSQKYTNLKTLDLKTRRT